MHGNLTVELPSATFNTNVGVSSCFILSVAVIAAGWLFYSDINFQESLNYSVITVSQALKDLPKEAAIKVFNFPAVVALLAGLRFLHFF